MTVKKSKSLKNEKNEVSLLISQTIAEKFPWFIPELVEYEIEFYLEKVCKSYFLSFSCNQKPIGLSQVSEERDLTYTALRPSIAFVAS